MTSRRRLGDFGERVAAHRLESAGMRILARNVRIGRIEIDLVAADGNDVVFVEVRTRRAASDMAAESLAPAKLRRMWRAAIGYCEANAIAPERARIDVIAIDLDPGGRERGIEHYRGIEIPEAPEDD
ncbi:MAG: YraN family protein [Dehalococcoidia bacterium]